MLLALAKFELRNLLRDRMTLIMFFWPLVLGSLGKYLIVNEIVEGQVLGVTAMMISLLAGFAYGAMGGFSLLDDRDDQVFVSIQISPVSLAHYIWFKVCFVFVFAVLAGFFMIWYIGTFYLTVFEIFIISVLSALQVPVVAFLINAFAKNKVEGFVTMKATGFLLLFPIGGFFFLDAKEWLFAVAPAHWPAKAVQASMLRPHIEAGLVEMNLTFQQYLSIGFLYNLLLIIAAYKFFKKKNHL